MKLTGQHLWVGLAVLAVLAPAAVLLYCFPPGTTWFYPPCMFHKMTGLSCPGCGGLRAAHQLLHGHLRQAFALNPMLIVLAPVLGWMAGAQLWKAATGRPVANPFKHPAWIWTLVALVVGFGILRNLPFPPFHPLGP